MECKKIMDRTFFIFYIHLPNDTTVMKAKYIFSNENKGQLMLEYTKILLLHHTEYYMF